MSADFEVTGDNPAAPFTLKLRRGEGMTLLSMDWKQGTPPEDFVGFAIECRPPGKSDFSPLRNRLSFATADGTVSPKGGPSTECPIQKFRWMHFPYQAEVDGEFAYRVTPVSMGADEKLSNGEAQTASIGLGGETYPEMLNVAFTRGFVSSQAFVDDFEPGGDIPTLVPSDPDEGLDFKPTHPKAAEALNWMGFEARRAVLGVLDQAVEDEEAQVRVVAYELNLPEVLSRLERLGARLKTIIDDSDSHGEPHSAESEAAARLERSAGAENVKRQHLGNLQHNKTIVVDGPKVKAVVCGSTNFSWRGFYVQSNNAVVLRGEGPVKDFQAAFDAYWSHDDVAGFGATPAAKLARLGLKGIDAEAASSPHIEGNELLKTIADDIEERTESSLLYSLAFLYQTPGPIQDAIEKVTNDDAIFVYGISDRKVGGIDVQKPNGNVAPVYPEELGERIPEPFKSEPTGGSGVRMHHKFVVIDHDKPTARVYLGSYNFSGAADTKNGENLVLVKDRRVATSYALEALRIFDHYHFRIADREAKGAGEPLQLAKPPRKRGEKPWWDVYYSDPQKARDREVFA